MGYRSLLNSRAVRLAAKEKQPKQLPWGHQSRHCVYCGKVGPRTMVAGGWAHKRCIPKQPKVKAEAR